MAWHYTCIVCWLICGKNENDIAFNYISLYMFVLAQLPIKAIFTTKLYINALGYATGMVANVMMTMDGINSSKLYNICFVKKLEIFQSLYKLAIWNRY